jgi:hypothetical protein
MKRRYAVFAVILVVSLLIGIQAVEIANANPVFTLPTRTSPPDAFVVSIKVLSPKENATYSNHTINVCFTKEVNSLPGVTTYVNFISDYQGDWMKTPKWCPFPAGADPAHENSFQVLQHNYTLTDIPEGYHTLTIYAGGAANYFVNGTEYNSGLLKIVDVHFYIDSNDNRTSSNQTSSPATPNPTPSIPEYCLAGGISILAVVSVSLVYLKKRKSKAV